MKERHPSRAMDADIEKARDMLAQGQPQDALVLALNVLQDALGNLRQGLLSLQDNLTRVRANLNTVSSPEHEAQAKNAVIKETKEPYYH